jgi:hypothetical protein
LGKNIKEFCVKEFKCSVMSELKQIRILSLKSLIVAFSSLECKVLYRTSWCTHHVLNHSKQTKNEEDIGLELERDLELFFLKIWSKLSLILFFCFLHCSFTSKAQRTFVALQFVCPMTQKLLNLVKEWGKLSQKIIHLKI